MCLSCMPFTPITHRLIISDQDECAVWRYKRIRLISNGIVVHILTVESYNGRIWKFLRIFMEWNGIVWVIFVLYRLLFGTVLKCDVRFVIFILVIATSTVYTHSWFVSGRKEANPVTCGSIADAEIHPKSIMVTSLSINVAIGLKIEHSVPFLPFSHFTFVWMGGVLRAFPLVVLFWTLWRIANRTGTTEISLGMVLQFWFAARLNQY